MSIDAEQITQKKTELARTPRYPNHTPKQKKKEEKRATNTPMSLMYM